MRDIEWATHNCTISFQTIGVWPEGADGTDVNNCARSSDCRLLVTADDFGKVKLYNYPVTQPKVGVLDLTRCTIGGSVSRREDRPGLPAADCGTTLAAIPLPIVFISCLITELVPCDGRALIACNSRRIPPGRFQNHLHWRERHKRYAMENLMIINLVFNLFKYICFFSFSATF